MSAFSISPDPQLDLGPLKAFFDEIAASVSRDLESGDLTQAVAQIRCQALIDELCRVLDDCISIGDVIAAGACDGNVTIATIDTDKALAACRAFWFNLNRNHANSPGGCSDGAIAGSGAPPIEARFSPTHRIVSGEWKDHAVEIVRVRANGRVMVRFPAIGRLMLSIPASHLVPLGGSDEEERSLAPGAVDEVGTAQTLLQFPAQTPEAVSGEDDAVAFRASDIRIFLSKEEICGIDVINVFAVRLFNSFQAVALPLLHFNFSRWLSGIAIMGAAGAIVKVASAAYLRLSHPCDPNSMNAGKGAKFFALGCDLFLSTRPAPEPFAGMPQ